VIFKKKLSLVTERYGVRHARKGECMGLLISSKLQDILGAKNLFFVDVLRKRLKGTVELMVHAILKIS